jgi:hypothetical protein
VQEPAREREGGLSEYRRTQGTSGIRVDVARKAARDRQQGWPRSAGRKGGQVSRGGRGRLTVPPDAAGMTGSDVLASSEQVAVNGE